jgi:hypothetical protein
MMRAMMMSSSLLIMKRLQTRDATSVKMMILRLDFQVLIISTTLSLGHTLKI